jgi:ATP-dependent 26S proteasome regulatory subunit
MATNRIDILDPGLCLFFWLCDENNLDIWNRRIIALLRPGRIDRKIEFPNPVRNMLRVVSVVLLVYSFASTNDAMSFVIRFESVCVVCDLCVERKQGEVGRLDILRIHSRRMNLTRGISLQKVCEVSTHEK